MGTIPRTQSISKCLFCEDVEHVRDALYTGPDRPTGRWELFHKHCHCDDDLGPAEELGLCPFCQHLRLHHLYQCREEISLWFKIKLPSLASMKRHQSCGFCRILVHTLTYNMSQVLTQHNSSMAGSLLRDRGFRDRFFIEIQIGQQTMRREINIRHRTDDPIRCLPDTLDWGAIQAWWQKSFFGKRNRIVSKQISMPQNFRVVDIHRRCVVQPPQDCQFIALSYVWGKVLDPTKLCAKKGTIELLSEDGVLSGPQLPVTIADTMEVCERLNERFLWVDRLCILQDSPDDQQCQINAMGDIYASASLVIIGACCSDTESPLTGLRSRSLQKQEAVLDLVFTNYLADPCRLRQISIWASRAWTYQEDVLAGYKIVFTVESILLEDGKGAIELEEGLLDLDSTTEQMLDWAREFATALPPAKTPFHEFHDHINIYTTRMLLFDADIYSAFEGILNRCFSDVGGHIAGIPRICFDDALLWSAQPDNRDFSNSLDLSLLGYDEKNEEELEESGVKNRLELIRNAFGPSQYHESNHRLRDGVGASFPTWSWSSIVGQVAFPLQQEIGTSYPPTLRNVVSLIHWYEYSGDAKNANNTIVSLRSVDVVGDVGDSNWVGFDLESTETLDYSILLYAALAWSNGCMHTASALDFPGDRSYDEWIEALKLRWPSYDIFWADVIRPSVPNMRPVLPIEQASHPMLICEAQTAYFMVKRYNTNAQEDLLGLVNNDGEVVGLLCRHDPMAKTHIWPHIADGNAKFEIMAISLNKAHIRALKSNDPRTDKESTVRGTIWDTLLHGEKSKISYHDSESNSLYPIPAVNVMVLGYKDGHHYRITIGWMLLTKWVDATRESKTIYLA